MEQILRSNAGDFGLHDLPQNFRGTDGINGAKRRSSVQGPTAPERTAWTSIERLSTRLVAWIQVSIKR